MSGLGFIPSEFRLIQGGGTLETIFLCDDALVPPIIPDGSLFLAKANGSIEDFLQLFVIFDDSFRNIKVNFVLLALGANDITKKEKQLNFNIKTQTLDFHNERKRSNRLVSQSFNTLCETLAELHCAKQIVSFDVMSRESSGYHNAAVEYVNSRVVRADDCHKHLNSWKIFQRDHRRKKTGKNENFPIMAERFDVDGTVTGELRQFLVDVALLALESDEESLAIGGMYVRRKF